MKRKLTLLLFIFIAFKVSSQRNVLYNYELGYYHDMNGQVIDGYYDIDYELDKTLKVSYNIEDNFVPGFYYDLKNNKIAGLIEYSRSNSYFRFKVDKNSNDRNFEPNECLSFVVGKDSFAVIENFKVKRDLTSGLKPVERDFVEVIDKVDNLVFYKHSRIIGFRKDDPIVTYLVKADSSKNYITFPDGEDKFKTTCLSIFGEFASLQTKVSAGEYTTDEDIPVMIKLLKYKHKFVRKERVYYNASWDEVDDVNKSTYYAIIKSLKNSVFHLSFHFNNGILIYDGRFTSFYPHKKTGDFIWYYPNGKMRKKINYIDNKPEKTTTYFQNGKIHYEYKFVKKTLLYNKVLNMNEKEVLDSAGCGIEIFYDSIASRQITNEFINNKLNTSYFLDSTNRKVYQFCGENAKLKSRASIEYKLNHKMVYPENSIRNFNHGCIFIRCIIEPSGLTSNMKVIKGMDAECDSSVLNILSYFRTGKEWNIAKINKEKVAQELIIPIDFSIKGFSRYRSNYNNSWMMHQMMQQQMMNMQQPKIPTYRF